MTPEQISELERLEQAATPAPWPNLACIHTLPTLEHVIANREIQLEARNALPSLIRDWRIMRKSLETISKRNDNSVIASMAIRALKELDNGH